MAAPVARRVLQQVRERALELRGVGADERQVGVDRQREGPGRERDVVDGGQDHLLDRAPLHARLGPARLQARHVQQVVDQARSRPASPAMSATSSRCSAGDSDAEPSAPAAVRIAVSGERRSCETARSSAVLSTSERRSALVSTTSRCSASRSTAAPRMASSAGTTRCCRRSRTAGGRPAGTSSVPRGRRLAQRQGDAALVALDGAQLDRRRAQLERVRQALRDRRQRLVEARAAQQQPRHLGRQVGLLATLAAPRAYGRGPLGQRAGDEGGDEEDDERDPVLALGDREAARRRDVEEVERRARWPAPSPRPASRPTPRRRAARRRGRRRRGRRPGRSGPADRSSAVVAATASAATAAPTAGERPSAPAVSRCRSCTYQA